MKRKSSKAQELLRLIVIREKIQKLTKEYRVILGIPQGGFEKESEVLAFEEKIKTDSYLYSFFEQYIEECREDIDILEEFIPTTMLYHLAYNGHVDVSKMNLNECQIDLLDFFNTGKLKIEIKASTTIKDLKEFVNQKSKYIRFIQDIYFELYKLKRPKRIKPSPNDIRDMHIYYFMTNYTKKELYEQLKDILSKLSNKEKGILSRTEDGMKKEEILARLLKIYPKPFQMNVSPDVIKTVTARQKRIREESTK